MKNTFATCLLVFTVLVAHNASAQDSEWYFGVSPVWTDDDADRAISDSVAGVQANLGYSRWEHFAVEGILGYSDIDGWFEDETHLEVGGNVVMFPKPEWAFSPYVVAGLGYLGVETASGANDDRPTGTLGLGFNWQFGESRWSARGEYRWRNAWDSDGSLTDRIGILGVSFAFGSPGALLPDPEPYVAPAPVPESDSDADGIVDRLDDCPRTPGGIPVDSVGCPVDSDRDGVIDPDDNCPNTPAGTLVSHDGCEIEDIIDLPGVTFLNNSDRLIDEAYEILDRVAGTLKRYPQLVVEIAGHTDTNGNADMNMNLSLRRAFAVRSHLIRAGVQPAQLVARGYGESSPIASNTTEAGQAQNRRVELRILAR
jgi:OOP family OmpA-OmpF porin